MTPRIEAAINKLLMLVPFTARNLIRPLVDELVSAIIEAARETPR